MAAGPDTLNLVVKDAFLILHDDAKMSETIVYTNGCRLTVFLMFDKILDPFLRDYRAAVLKRQEAFLAGVVAALDPEKDADEIKEHTAMSKKCVFWGEDARNKLHGLAMRTYYTGRWGPLDAEGEATFAKHYGSGDPEPAFMMKGQEEAKKKEE